VLGTAAPRAEMRLKPRQVLDGCRRPVHGTRPYTSGMPRASARIPRKKAPHPPRTVRRRPPSHHAAPPAFGPLSRPRCARCGIVRAP
jgi:hypothetical protein